MERIAGLWSSSTTNSSHEAKCLYVFTALLPVPFLLRRPFTFHPSSPIPFHLPPPRKINSALPLRREIALRALRIQAQAHQPLFPWDCNRLREIPRVLVVPARRVLLLLPLSLNSSRALQKGDLFLGKRIDIPRGVLSPVRAHTRLLEQNHQ
jgi:hypothetical protein